MTVLEVFRAWSLPRRILVSILVGFIAGPGLIGFLSEYATYLYALGADVRPPVEGIPYLRASVTLFSMTLATLVGLIFWLARGVVGLLVGQVILAIEGYARLPKELWRN